MFQYTVALSESLQKQDTDLVKAVMEPDVLVNILPKLRRNDDQWDEIYQIAIDMTTSYDIIPSIRRLTGYQKNRPNVPVKRQT